jgi:hypothetical protein
LLRRTCLIALAGAALAAPAHAADPLAYRAGQNRPLERAAAAGHSHVLYARSPDGVFATAQRTSRFRGRIERAARGTGFSPDTLEAMVFLESAGRPDVIAGSDPAAASGLAQIMAETGRGFLGMRVDLARSRRLTRAIQHAHARGRLGRARRLEARRRIVDQRFSPPHALAGMARYLGQAHGYLGRRDLAVASYHMGIGNVQHALRAYGAKRVAYARLYFDSAPDRHARAWRVLQSMSDDSRHYYFKVLAAKEIMRLYRTDRGRLATLATLHARKLSAEEVIRPAATTRQFQRPREIVTARRRGYISPLPRGAGLAYSRELGQLARRLKRPRALYHGLRPEAAATLEYIGRRVRKLSRSRAPLIVTSTLRDYRYQRLLLRSNSMATPGYSLHTTGYAFDIARTYRSPRQAAAFEFVLERLQSRGIIEWIREPGAIHVAVSPRSRILLQKTASSPAQPRAKRAPGKKAKPKATAKVNAGPALTSPRPRWDPGPRRSPRSQAPQRAPKAEEHSSPFVRFFAKLRF